MFFLPTSLGTVTGLVATGAVGAFVARVTRRRNGSVAAGAPRSGGGPVPRMLTQNPGVARRTRVGRLRLPRAVVELTPHDEPALAAVNDFADRLADLPMSAWLEVGRSVMDSRSSDDSRPTSYAILAATINDCGLSVTAWYVRDAIETSAFYASHAVRCWKSGDRRAFAAAHAAAEDAALALLAREFLPASDRATLCGPFDSMVQEVLPLA